MTQKHVAMHRNCYLVIQAVQVRQGTDPAGQASLGAGVSYS